MMSMARKGLLAFYSGDPLPPGSKTQVSKAQVSKAQVSKAQVSKAQASKAQVSIAQGLSWQEIGQFCKSACCARSMNVLEIWVPVFPSAVANR
jgi:hypothetical protein